MSARRWVACVEGGCLAFLLLVAFVAVRSEWLIERRHERVVRPRATAVAHAFGDRVDDVAYRVDEAVDSEQADLVARGSDEPLPWALGSGRSDAAKGAHCTAAPRKP